MFFHLGHFFLSWCTCYVKGWSLRCSTGQGNTGPSAVTLYVGEGLRGSNDACSSLCQIAVTPFATHNQIGPLWCWFPSGWACPRFRPLWVSPTTSPLRLGVSPAASSTPTGVFTQRFEALFPCSGALGYAVCFASPPFLPVYLCSNVGPRAESASCRIACSIRSTIYLSGSASLIATSPLHPGCPSPPLLLVCMNVSSLSPWLSDFHIVQFSVSSVCFLFLNCCCPSFGCARRCSVSTYASILAETPLIFNSLHALARRTRSLPSIISLVPTITLRSGWFGENIRALTPSLGEDRWVRCLRWSCSRWSTNTARGDGRPDLAFLVCQLLLPPRGSVYVFLPCDSVTCFDQ